MDESSEVLFKEMLLHDCGYAPMACVEGAVIVSSGLDCVRFLFAGLEYRSDLPNLKMCVDNFSILPLSDFGTAFGSGTSDRRLRLKMDRKAIHCSKYAELVRHRYMGTAAMLSIGPVTLVLQLLNVEY